MVGAAAAAALSAGYTETFAMDDVYDLFQRGTALLEAGDFNSATVPCPRRATWSRRRPRSARRSAARTSARSSTRRPASEFEAVVERAPTNDFALFCLGRSLMLLGRHKEARKPLALAAQLRPERRDYRLYRERVARGRLKACSSRSAVLI